MNAVKISEASFSRAGQHILQDISMEAAKGEFLAIIGPNGAGKTTLLRLAAGLEQPDSGCVEMLGRAVSSYTRREFAAQVALVPQEVPLEMPFKVAETVLLGRSPHLGLWEMEGEKDRQLAIQAMQAMHVEHLAGRRLDQLSWGERQRVFIARAICQQPRVLLLDEPTASLDPAHQVGIMDLLEELCRKQGLSVIMVSHELNLAAIYANRMLLLSRGRIAGTGTPQEVLTRELLEKSYGCRIMVDENPLGKVPRMMPVPGRYHEQG